MSASEIERLRAALREFGEHKVECGLWDCFYPDEITNGPIHDECTCGLSAALSDSSAPQAAAPATPEELRGALLAADMVLIVLERGDQSRPVAVVSGLISNARAVIDAALSTATPEDAEGGSQKGSGR